MPEISLVDINGKERSLLEFNGKILYIGIWATTCGSSIAMFPYQEQLFKRLNNIQIDTSIQLINIHIDDSKKQWFNTLKKHNPIGVNLFSSDTSLLTKWNISAPPTYILLDKSGKVVAKDISHPDEASFIDYILYSLVKEVNIIEALWTMHRQAKLMEQFKTSSALSNNYYRSWFNLTVQSFIDFQNWRTEHMKKKSR